MLLHELASSIAAKRNFVISLISKDASEIFENSTESFSVCCSRCQLLLPKLFVIAMAVTASFLFFMTLSPKLFS